MKRVPIIDKDVWGFCGN